MIRVADGSGFETHSYAVHRYSIRSIEYLCTVCMDLGSRLGFGLVLKRSGHARPLRRPPAQTTVYSPSECS